MKTQRSQEWFKKHPALWVNGPQYEPFGTSYRVLSTRELRAMLNLAPKNSDRAGAIIAHLNLRASLIEEAKQ